MMKEKTKTKIPYKNCVWFYIVFNIIPIIKFREEIQVTTDHENVVQQFKDESKRINSKR